METKQFITAINTIGASKVCKWVLQDVIAGHPASVQVGILNGMQVAAKAADKREDAADVAIPAVAAMAARQVKELHDEVDEGKLFAAYSLGILAATAAFLKGEALHA